MIGRRQTSEAELKVAIGRKQAPEAELKVAIGRKLVVAVEFGGVMGANTAPEAGLRR